MGPCPYGRKVSKEDKHAYHQELLACLSVDPKMADLDVSYEAQDGLICPLA